MKSQYLSPSRFQLRARVRRAAVSYLPILLLVLGSDLRGQDRHRIEVLLSGDGRPAAARLRLVDQSGKEWFPRDAVVRKTQRGESYFYAEGAFGAELPAGETVLHVAGGMEQIPQQIPIKVDGDYELTVRTRPWINMAARGWYSGDSHVHLHTGGPLGVTVKDALTIARAEGLNYVNLCVSNNVGDDIRDADLITGRPHPASTDNHLLVFGEEMRSSIYGHMQFFGIKKLVEPQYTGFDDTPRHHDFPANFVMALEANRQGGLVTYGHPMFTGQPIPYGDDLTAGNAAARELPIDAVLGVVQAVDLMCYNSDEPLSADLWYRLLNCGLRLSACVGTDALLDRATDPMGGERVYVKLEGPFTMESWLEGLKAGRTFVTNGPMIQLEVDGGLPGETISVKRGSVQVKARIESYVPVERIEVIVNVMVAAEKVIPEAVRAQTLQVHEFDVDLPLRDSSWVAVRVRGGDHPHIFDGPAWAHTSPVYALVGEKPIRNRSDAQFFVDWIEQLLKVVAVRNRYARPEDRQQVEQLFRKAQDQFRELGR